MVENSILKSVKNHLGLPLETTGFDSSLLIFINSAFMVLNQLGVGPTSPFIITDDATEWTEFSESVDLVPTVKLYVCLKTQLSFDPPTVSFLLEAAERSLHELEERIKIQQEIIIPNLPPME